MTVLGNYEVVHPSGEITAYDDPEQRPGTTLDEGGLRDSLLQRLHADLFHNRSAPVPAPLARTASGRSQSPVSRLSYPTT